MSLSKENFQIETDLTQGRELGKKKKSKVILSYLQKQEKSETKIYGQKECKGEVEEGRKEENKQTREYVGVNR